MNIFKPLKASSSLYGRRLFFSWPWRPSSPVVYPDREVGIHKTTRIFPQSIIHGTSDLHPLLILSGRIPLLLNFTIRGTEESGQLSRTLYALLNYQIRKKVYCVDVESDMEDNRDLLLYYGVTKVPSIVALQAQRKIGVFEDNGGDTEAALRDWINEIAVD